MVLVEPDPPWMSISMFLPGELSSLPLHGAQMRSAHQVHVQRSSVRSLQHSMHGVGAHVLRERWKRACW